MWLCDSFVMFCVVLYGGVGCLVRVGVCCLRCVRCV